MALIGKDQLVHEVAERSGLGVEESRRALEEMLNAIETELGNGNEVRLTGFGKFSVSRRKAREGRNPQTGESMRIPAKKVPHFSPGTELKKAVPDPPLASAAAGTKQARKPSGAGAKPQEKRSSGKRPRKGVGPKPRRTAKKVVAADEGQHGEADAGKAGSVVASGAKFAIVGIAGLAAGVAGGLVFVHKR